MNNKMKAKLKQLKIDLKKWNNETFGNIHTRVASAKDSLLKVQLEIDSLGYNDIRTAAEAQAQVDMFDALKYEESYWKEKSRVKWLAEGDKNTSFFHKIAKQRSASCKLNYLKCDVVARL